ncbi:UPF0545 protein C22orf39 homolog [Fundulus heteroclitus]|uniref:UPF0545 protein C22orf39 homolog n=1 Tax=Fundulus heteroclitus TaxID=8078 RepID=UPI00165A549D|nr:UPF0545 protein C22orf39 homolog [Fundulus heteroclitus]
MERPVDEAWRPPRACDDYLSEFRHCGSFSNRFHHYYTYGTVRSCQQWEVDYRNCREWESHRLTKAKDALQKSERSRLAEQENFTPVWKLRKEPPSDWHRPLDQGNQQNA